MPRKADPQSTAYRHNVYISPDEWNGITAAAEARGMNVSQYLLACHHAAEAKRDPDARATAGEVREAIRVLQRIHSRLTAEGK